MFQAPSLLSGDYCCKVIEGSSLFSFFSPLRSSTFSTTFSTAAEKSRLGQDSQKRYPPSRERTASESPSHLRSYLVKHTIDRLPCYFTLQRRSSCPTETRSVSPSSSIPPTRPCNPCQKVPRYRPPWRTSRTKHPHNQRPPALRNQVHTANGRNRNHFRARESRRCDDKPRPA